MAKKLSGDKSKGSKPHRPSRKHRDQNTKTSPAAGQGPMRPEEEPTNQGIPEEHYYGERNSRTPGSPGDLEDETLSKDAPYNRTYGQEQAGNG
jgi:hypothetical protein